MVAEAKRRIALDVSWDLKFDGRLAGSARIARRDGDLLIPGDPPVPLGLTALALDLTATPSSAGASRLDARLALATEKMGVVNGTASAVLAVDAQGGMALDARQPIRAKLDADIADLAWVGLFVGDAMEVGGTVKANVEAQGTLTGKWTGSGAIRGDRLRVVRIDDGVRLVEGKLAARLDGDSLVLDSLRFPASLRVMPAEWRTKEWITTNPEAKDGYAEASGRWSLTDGGGQLRLTLYRFPALQRSDRYAMVSGTVDLNVALPRIDIVGDLKADAGWFSLEILQGVPTLDDDVKVRRPGDDPGAASTPLQTSMNLKFDMGPRFYITGMGLDAGLLGSIQILLSDGRLTGVGALRTRGGGIEAYGQKLRLRRGTLTFQGRLDNPVLDIEALRTGEQVEAGVKVAGTAQRPRIDLVSYPDVSDVEKLSWLLLGRGPDGSGGDAALLLSVGTALLGGGGPPFYKQFGLDDVSIRSGNIGSSGSLLPDRTVAGDVNRDSDSRLATQFLVASKTFANGITLSVEQALAGADTVGRASYRLSRRWSVDLKGGAVNGIALVYRTFSGTRKGRSPKRWRASPGAPRGPAEPDPCGLDEGQLCRGARSAARDKIRAVHSPSTTAIMSIKSDRWIRRQAEAGMIEPFEAGQVRTANGGRIVSYGTSSYGYDVRCADEFKIFTNINSTIVDPKNFDEGSFVDFKGDVCIIPPNSFALARTVEYFRIPRSVLTICLGKSTYARCGIIVNVTPLEPEWEGHVTLEFSNTTPLPAKIYAGEGCAQMLFLESDEVCETSYRDRGGKYQGQRGVTLPRT